MTKTAALHIGVHKTGTSLVQRYLRQAASSLSRSRARVLGRTEMGECIAWGDRLVNTPELMVAKLDEFQNNDRFDVLIGSNENSLGRPFLPSSTSDLYPAGPRNIEALARTIRGDLRPLVFVSIRPQAEFLESYYLQTINEGGSLPFDRWLAKVDLDRLSWSPIVNALHAWFGRENVQVVDFRLVRQGAETYCRRFLDVLDLPFDPRALVDTPINRSLSDKGLRLALAANPLLHQRTDHSALRRFLQEHFSNVDHPRPSLLTASDRAWIDARYSEEYESLVSQGDAAVARAGT